MVFTDVDADLGHRRDRTWIDAARAWAGPGRTRIHACTQERAAKALGHLAAARVAGAQEQRAGPRSVSNSPDHTTLPCPRGSILPVHPPATGTCPPPRQ